MSTLTAPAAPATRLTWDGLSGYYTATCPRELFDFHVVRANARGDKWTVQMWVRSTRTVIRESTETNLRYGKMLSEFWAAAEEADFDTAFAWNELRGH